MTYTTLVLNTECQKRHMFVLPRGMGVVALVVLITAVAVAAIAEI